MQGVIPPIEYQTLEQQIESLERQFSLEVMSAVLLFISGIFLYRRATSPEEEMAKRTWKWGIMLLVLVVLTASSLLLQSSYLNDSYLESISSSSASLQGRAVQKQQQRQIRAVPPLNVNDQLPQVGDTVSNFRSPETLPSSDAITLVTQLSCQPHSRLEIMQSLVREWNGPASVTIFIQSPDEVEMVTTLYDNDAVLQKHVALHLVYMNNTAVKTDPDFIQFGVVAIYPVNKLRNVALEQVKSDWVLYLDCDFKVFPRKHDILQRMVAAELVQRANNNEKIKKELLVFVLPAFDEFMAKPTTKSELLKTHEHYKAQRGKDLPYFAQNRCPWCHGGTNYPKWLTSNESYKVDYTLQ
jgi:hypothetical protein